MDNETIVAEFLTRLSSDIMQLIDEARKQGDKQGYHRGASDTKRELLAFMQMSEAARDNSHIISNAAQNALSQDGTTTIHSVGAGPYGTRRADDGSGDDALGIGARKRAPKGLPAALTERTLQGNPRGSTANDILMSAANDFERMIKLSTIHGELRRGQAKGRYQERHGLWFLANAGIAE